MAAKFPDFVTEGIRGDVGYLVTDSVSGTTRAIVNQIRAMPETIKLRVLI